MNVRSKWSFYGQWKPAFEGTGQLSIEAIASYAETKFLSKLPNLRSLSKTLLLIFT